MFKEQSSKFKEGIKKGAIAPFLMILVKNTSYTHRRRRYKLYSLCFVLYSLKLNASFLLMMNSPFPMHVAVGKFVWSSFSDF